MVDILHRVGVKTAAPDEVYDALTTVDGLAGWWTEDTKGSGEVGGTLKFRFPVGGFDMEVVELRPSERVVWRVIDGPEEWVGTTVDWNLRQDGEYTIVLFIHQGWKEPVEFMHHCSTKWGSFLMSLKSLVETGKGAPAPSDVQISDCDAERPGHIRPDAGEAELGYLFLPEAWGYGYAAEACAAALEAQSSGSVCGLRSRRPVELVFDGAADPRQDRCMNIHAVRDR